MKRKISLAAVVLWASMAVAAPHAMAEDSSTVVASEMRQKPLIVIRFAENFIPYQSPLTRAVQQAKSEVPDVAFDIVAVYPDKGGFFDHAVDEAGQRAKAVASVIMQQGISKDHIHISYQPNKTASMQEVHVFLK